MRNSRRRHDAAPARSDQHTPSPSRPRIKPASAHQDTHSPSLHPGAAMGNQALQSLRSGVLAGRGLSRPGDSSEIQAHRTADRVIAASSPAHAAPLPASDKAGGGPGEPLPGVLRSYFEPRFGTSLDQVRIRRDRSAAREAMVLQARAFTAGNVISFAQGQYDPQSSAGLRLLAHELAHVTSDAGSNVVHRDFWEIDDSARTIDRNFFVNLNFENTFMDYFNGTAWTDARKSTFRAGFESSIESTFNNSNIIIRPPQSYADVLPQDNITQGYKPSVDILLPPGDGSWPSLLSDWEVDVAANPNGTFMTSTANTSIANLDEADNTAIGKQGAPAGVTQIPTVHEFGHFLGLHHPGHGLAPGALSPGAADEYGHSGQDVHGHDVSGPTDLLGTGMQLRPFYFDEWARALDRHVAELRRQQMLDGVLRNIENFLFPRPPMGDFPTPPTDGPRYG